MSCFSLSALFPISTSRLYLLATLSLRFSSFWFPVLHLRVDSGAIMPIDPTFLSECSLNTATSEFGSNCIGGMARRMAFVQAAKQQDNNTIAIDLGSSFFGGGACMRCCSVFFLVFKILFLSVALYGPTYMANLMAPVGYDVIGITESDFFQGPSVLQSYIKQFQLLGSSAAFVLSKYIFFFLRLLSLHFFFC